MGVKNLSWQQLAVLVVCLGAAFAANKWLGVNEGTAGLVVTSIVAFLLGRDNPQDPPSPPSPPSPPTLKAIGFAGVLALACFPGCGTMLAAKDPNAVLAKCTAEARAEHYVGGVSVEEALAVFDRCMIRESV